MHKFIAQKEKVYEISDIRGKFFVFMNNLE